MEQEYKDIQTELSPLYADVKRLWAIHYNIYEVQHEQERQQTQLRSRKNEIELGERTRIWEKLSALTQSTVP